jgi:diaminohydroxyphosphoribosylaminopyrimidine deaminase/5-amino-6-(5-phosphoribosylamino)uracil reductase
MAETDSTDERFMRRALKLARKAQGCVSPNPLVGAVIVRDGRIIAEGYHHCCGGAHAEIDAISRATGRIAGATFYVTLEPCSHHGRTPPCADALVQQKPARVVVGAIDPNPLVSGRGLAALQRAGIETSVGVLEEECRELNRVFFKYIQTGRPFVTLKFAQTLDGRIATAAGHSRWISSPPSLRFAHRLRATHDAVLVGAGTVAADDPRLTCRLVRGRDPLRIVVDSRLRLPPEAQLFSDGKRTLAVCGLDAPPERRKALERRGIEVMPTGTKSGRVDLAELLERLGKRGISSLLVEGGATLATAFLREGLADRLIVILAPKITGAGIEAVGDLGIRRMDDALAWRYRRIVRCGEDLILDARPRENTPAPPVGTACAAEPGSGSPGGSILPPVAREPLSAQTEGPLCRPDPVEGGTDDAPGVAGPLPAGEEPPGVYSLAVLAPQDTDGRGGPGLHPDQQGL